MFWAEQLLTKPAETVTINTGVFWYRIRTCIHNRLTPSGQVFSRPAALLRPQARPGATAAGGS